MEELKRARLRQERRQVEEWINNSLEYKRNLMIAFGDNSEHIRTCESYIQSLERRLDKIDQQLE